MTYLRNHWPIVLGAFALSVAVAMVAVLAGGDLVAATGAAQVTGLVATGVGIRRKAAKAKVAKALDRLEALDAPAPVTAPKSLEALASEADKWL